MMSEKESLALRDYLEQRLSLTVPETNHTRLNDFVDHRLREKGWSFTEYMDCLSHNKEEIDLVIDASTIGETYFFRDESHFSLLLKEFLPFFAGLNYIPLAWSAAASTGEEALSIAALYAQFYGGTDCLAGKIWASDINSKSLGAITHGKYRNRSLRDDGSCFHASLEPWIQRTQSGFEVNQRLYSPVGVRTINLMTDSFESIPGLVDILFLKNMMIYFPHDRRKVIYQKVSSKLSPQGILILGKAEVPFFEDPDMVMIERNGIFFFIHKTSSFPDFMKRKIYE